MVVSHPDTSLLEQYLIRSAMSNLFESLGSEVGENKGSLVDSGVVVSAELDLLLGGPLSQGCLDIPAGLLAADHEADLAGGVGGNRGESVFGHGEDFLAVLLQFGDQGKVEPLALGCSL